MSTMMAPASAGLRRRCSNALYLNNAAVKFLVCGEYHRAAQACKGALWLLKSLVTMTPSSQAEAASVTGTIGCANINSFEQIAISSTAQRLACLSTQTFKRRAIHPQLQVVTFDESLTASFVQTDIASYTLLAILIDDLSLSSCCEDQVTMAAIVLSNFALARWFLSLQSMDDFLPSDTAWHLLDNGLSIIGVHDRTMDVSEGNMFVAVTLSCNLYSMLCELREMGDEGESNTAIACSIRQDLALLVELSHTLTNVTSTFVPLAGSA
jgi:hypothetical protein